jgi:PST family polysaccharide transporter
MVLLARLLNPADFGLITMVAVITGFAILFLDLGFGAVVIQKQDIQDLHLSSIFWLNIVLGIILTIIIIALSPWIAQFYNEPQLRPVTILLSLNFIIASFGIVHLALLQKHFEFRKLMIVETLAMFISGAIGVGMAFLGYGVWSLVWRSLSLTILTVFFTWVIGFWTPKLVFDLSAVKSLIGYSSNLLGFNTVNYWTRNIDDLLVGRFIGSASLGVYNKAYQLMLLPLTQVSAVVSRVMFPVLSSIQEDKDLVKKVYLQAVSYVALLTFPMMLGLLVVADSFVLAFFGDQWSAVVPILQLFCVVGLVQSISTTTGWLYLSQGQTDWMFRWGLFAGIVKTIGILIGLKYGIMGVAVGYTLSTLIFLTYPGFVIAGRLINLKFCEIIHKLGNIFGCSAGMSILVWMAGIMLPDDWQHWIYLAIQVPLGILIYAVSIHLFKLEAYEDIRGLVRGRMSNHLFDKIAKRI